MSRRLGCRQLKGAKDVLAVVLALHSHAQQYPLCCMVSVMENRNSIPKALNIHVEVQYEPSLNKWFLVLLDDKREL